MSSYATTQDRYNVMPNDVFGFWIYIMSDCILFATLFATYIVLHNNTYGGPGISDLVSLYYILTETLLLLTSSFTYGLAMLASFQKKQSRVLLLLGITFILGFAFVTLEVREFLHLIHEGYGPQRSGFLSAFFTLVGTHGLHVSAGLVWMASMMVQLYRHGITHINSEKLTCLGLFWHFLDIVWIFVFTIVYLMGAA